MTTNMKKTLLLLTWIILSTLAAQAQLPTYQCALKNDSLLSPTVYEFDIWLKNTSATTFELGNFQTGILVNPAISGGGSITVELLPAGSGLNPAQQPASVLFSAADNCLKVAPKAPPVFGEGFLVPAMDDGVRVCRLRITCSIAFATAKPDLAFNFTVFPYNTVVSAFDRTTHLLADITSAGSHTVTGLVNPMLNAPVAAFDVSGSGSYCAGSPGGMVILSGSETGVSYQLKKNGFNNGPEVNGTGSVLSWAGCVAGTYTVSARRTGTYITGNMNGSAIITADEPAIGGTTAGGTTITLGAATDTLRLSGQFGSVINWQKQVDAGGYTDIPATAGLEAYLETPSATGTWEYRAVVVNGTCPPEYAAPAVVIVSAGPVMRSWTGVINEKWNNYGNWSPAGVPGAQDDVLIPASAPNMPVVRIDGFSCNDVLVKSGASLTIIPGIILTVNGTMTLEE